MTSHRRPASWRTSTSSPAPSRRTSAGPWKRATRRRCRKSQAQIRWGQTPLTSCFFDGCIERGRDLAAGTKYNILSCGGIAFANAVDCLAAIREVVYDKRQATLDEVAQACAANFQGHERLRADCGPRPSTATTTRVWTMSSDWSNGCGTSR